jgi:hypothetical protein
VITIGIVASVDDDFPDESITDGAENPVWDSGSDDIVDDILGLYQARRRAPTADNL